MTDPFSFYFLELALCLQCQNLHFKNMGMEKRENKNLLSETFDFLRYKFYSEKNVTTLFLFTFRSFQGHNFKQYPAFLLFLLFFNIKVSDSGVNYFILPS